MDRLVSEVDFIMDSMHTFPNTLQRYQLLMGNLELLLPPCMLQAILNPWSNQEHPSVLIAFDLAAHNI